MNYKILNQQLGNIDLYLLDQILKGRFEGRQRILDAGCGEGRNLKYFIDQGREVHGVDNNPMAIKMAQMTYREQKDNFKVGSLESLEYDDDYFGAIICSAVLHFARDEAHFIAMMEAMVRALKPTGLFFIRMATTEGLSAKEQEEQGFTYFINLETLNRLIEKFNLRMLEPFKTVVVANKRSMATIVLEKVS